jgi:benzodiazapine receptor
MTSDILRQVTNVIAYALTLIINYLAVTLPLGGQTTAEIANRYPIYFLPANFTFSIWSVIYLALGVYVVDQLRPSQRENPLQRRIGYLFALTCVANVSWLLLFQNLQFGASMVAMLALLGLLIAIYLRLEIGTVPRSLSERLRITLPFSLYLGWISVATIANASYVLYDLGWNGFGISGAIWAAIMLVVAAGLTVAIILRGRDIAFTLVICWAFAGIAIKQVDTPLVSASAIVLAVLLLAILIVALAADWRTVRPPRRLGAVKA